ncbi:MAG TPA: WD40 repeat domain-containing protein, partial [Candidatus Sulfomarinibacteraceae bacterium]|nr:WD40 repeat domain-containing protein [Candidatus Sulfomarinibacteraceae bacterium]
EEQRRFAGLLRKLVDDADVHVVLAMRDDFLYRCQGLEPLHPVFDGLLPLEQPDSESLGRALVEPARRQGYAFEDHELPREMVAEVEGGRGALPMLAFAVARLWEKRNREHRLLTRRAYAEIGKVGGALAKHAEATLTALGDARLPIVRELFRNLVTAEGTRAVREWDELLSVFCDSSDESPEEVLRELIDARLLTSYEVREEDREPTRRIEVVHESLLSAWPRLLRWQTQDADAAQLRDQLRQAAKTWDEHDRSDDLLWTGAVYREFASWRERYPGGLSELEEAFASAMTSLAMRRRRRRRIAASAAVVVALVVASVFGILWRRSVLETRRAEAQKLIAMGQLRLEDHPTAAMVYAAASLELRDTDEARLLALRALWQGPTYFVVNDDPSISCEFSPSGEWLVQTLEASNVMHIIGRDGSQRSIERPSETGKTRGDVWFQDHHDLFVSAGSSTDLGRFALWSASEARMLAAGRLEHDFKYDPWVSIVSEGEAPRALIATTDGELVWVDALYADGRHEQVGEIRLETPISEGSRLCMPRSSPWLALVDGRRVSLVEIGAGGLGMRRLLGTRAEGDPAKWCAVDPLGRFVLTPLGSGKFEVWDPTGERPPSSFDGPPRGRVEFSRDGSHLIGFARSPGDEDLSRIWFWSVDDGTFHLRRKIEDITYAGGTLDPARLQFAARGPIPDNRLWPLAGPSSAEPLLLRRGPAGYVQMVAFSPDGRWLATNHKPDGLAIWPLVGPIQLVKRMDVNFWVRGPAFGPQGRFLAYVADRTVFVTPLEGAIPAEEHVAYQLQGLLAYSLAVSPDGRRFAAGGGGGTLWIGADDGAGPTELKGDEGWLASIERVAFSPDGRLVAFLSGFFDLSTARVPVWDLESNEAIASLSLPGEEFGVGVAFIDDGRLLTATTKGVVAWDVRSETAEVLAEGRIFMFGASPDGRRLVVTEQGPAGMASDPAGPPTYFDLDSGQSTTLSTHGPRVWAVALDP